MDNYIIPLSPFFTYVLRAVDECFQIKIAALQGFLLCEVHVQVCRISQIEPRGFHFPVPKNMICKELILPGLFQNANPFSPYLQKCVFEFYIIRIHFQTQHICRKR